LDILAILALTFTPINMLVVFLGVVLGVAVGALPGFTASMGIAVLIPITWGMPPVQGLLLLAALYVGANYGGAIPAILLRTPGMPASVMTAQDGYALSKEGKGMEALNEAAISSFWGGQAGALALLLIAPPLARAALRFGPQENFMLAVFGLSIIASLVGKSLLKGIISGLFGLMIGTVGVAPFVGQPRYTFGMIEFFTGIALVPALIGIFSISQVFAFLGGESSQILDEAAFNLKRAKFKFKELIGYPLVYLRGSIIGIIIGTIPGPGASIASFISYDFAKSASKNPELFGNGSREAIASVEVANSAIAGGNMIPMLTLGIPGNAVTAVMLGGLMIQGLFPGHALFTDRADVVYPFMIGLFAANFFVLIIGLFAARYFIGLVKVPVHILAVIIIIVAILGAYAINTTLVDVYVMLGFGILGFFMKRFGFEAAPLVLGMILGPIAEQGLQQTIALARGESIILNIITRPICIALLGMTFLSLIGPPLREMRKKRKAQAAQVTK